MKRDRKVEGGGGREKDTGMVRRLERTVDVIKLGARVARIEGEKGDNWMVWNGG